MHIITLRAPTWPRHPFPATPSARSEQASRGGEPGTLTAEEIREIVLEILG